MEYIQRPAVFSEYHRNQVTIPVKKKQKRDVAFNSTFEFEDEFGEVIGGPDFGYSSLFKSSKGRNVVSTLDQKIAQVRKSNRNEDTTVGDDIDMDGDDEGDLSGDENVIADTVKVKKKKKKKKGDLEETAKKQEFAESIEEFDATSSFHDMNLSRPLLRALGDMSFLTPTPIQSATIPVALLGKDICACAITGSGKTAAFMLPIMERLLYKPKNAPVTRVLVLTPTRELAVQIHQVSRRLSHHTNITLALATGGLDIKTQTAALRFGPDIVIATPGRLIDHLHNSPNFSLTNIEVLVLDEADRMLDEYFAEQMKEVIRLCSSTRQTMLFSATMTDEVKDLAAVSLKDPVKVFISENTEVADNLRQEFIRVRANREGDREAIITALVSRTFCDHCIVFLQTKKLAHRLHIVLGLLGVRVGELHGNLSQAQRLDSLKKFSDAEIDVLLATDLAARGLDIEGIKTVINFTMPNTVKHYVHRVGRTARAGKSGRSISLVGEKERKMLKEIVKKAKGAIKSRIISQEVIAKYRDKISSLESTIETIIKEQVAEKEMRTSENKLNRVENLMANKGEGEPKRTWFQSHSERKASEHAQKLGEYSLTTKKMKAVKKKKSTAEDRVEREITKSQLFAARAAKRTTRQGKLGTFATSTSPGTKVANKKKKQSSFHEELTDTSRSALKKFRAGPSYQEKKEALLQKRQKGKSNNKQQQQQQQQQQQRSTTVDDRHASKPSATKEKRPGNGTKTIGKQIDFSRNQQFKYYQSKMADDCETQGSQEEMILNQK